MSGTTFSTDFKNVVLEGANEGLPDCHDRVLPEWSLFPKNLKLALKNKIKLGPDFVMQHIRNAPLFCDDMIEPGAFGLDFLKNLTLMTLAAQSLVFPKIMTRETFQK